jgi:hypothetical protein
MWLQRGAKPTVTIHYCALPYVAMKASTISPAGSASTGKRTADTVDKVTGPDAPMHTGSASGSARIV